MKKSAFTSFGLFLLFQLGIIHTAICQAPLDLDQKLLVYKAFFILPNGDTLTSETIEMQFTKDPWVQGQKDLRITYHTDNVGIKGFVHPFEKMRTKYAKNQKKKEEGKKGWDTWTWLQEKETTGYKLTDTTFFMHPPRENQYLYNELSNMPRIDLNKLLIGGSWPSKLLILTGWHDFKGTLESLYQVTGRIAYEQGSVNIQEAWDIKVEHAHSELGQYQSRIIFDQASHGFLHFDNAFPDGNRIVMSLIEVKTVPNQE